MVWTVMLLYLGLTMLLMMDQERLCSEDDFEEYSPDKDCLPDFQYCS